MSRSSSLRTNVSAFSDFRSFRRFAADVHAERLWCAVTRRAGGESEIVAHVRLGKNRSELAIAVSAFHYCGTALPARDDGLRWRKGIAAGCAATEYFTSGCH